MLHDTRTTRAFLCLLALLSVASTAMATLVFRRITRSDGLRPLDIPLQALFAILFLWITIGFWTAMFGFIREFPFRRRPAEVQAAVQSTPVAGGLPATAIVIPIYNEDPTAVFAAVRTIHEDVRNAGQGDVFDIFVLSDTTDPDVWLDEEIAWACARTALSPRPRLFYRRRQENTGRKSGNIADFCRRWGGLYRYMVVLDADSLVTGDTLTEMVRRMEANSGIGILQVPPVPINRRSLFARLQQFAAHLYGEIFVSGYALWAQMEGNYWGHNAIIRVQAFAACCGLPRLPGEPPLGGEFLSHDFAEAAYMQQGGWKVVVAHDMDGSYEECPTNLVDFAKRDQRWCQGNLQHLRLAVASGVRPVSRLHLAMGVMSYVSSPLWALFMVLAVLKAAGMRSQGPIQPPGFRFGSALGLFVVTMLLLLLPKILSTVLVLLRPARLAQLGGPARVLLSVVLETVASIAMAPILMLYHTMFVIFALFGKSIQWDAQRRCESRLGFRDALQAHAPHTIVGLLAVLLIQWFAPHLLPWAAPVLLGLVFSIPLSVLLGSSAVGLHLRRRGLLLIPEEIRVPPIIRRQRYARRNYARSMHDAPHPFLRVMADPALNHLHRAMLGKAPGTPERLELARLARIALSGGAAHLTRRERMAVVSDPESLRWLHHEVWKDWPVDLLERIAASARRQTRRGRSPEL